MVKRFAALERKCHLARQAFFTEFDETLARGASVESGCNEQADFVDQTFREEGTVDAGAALQQKALDAKLAIESVEHGGKIELRLCGDDVGNAVSRQFGKMAVRHVATKKDDDVIAVDFIFGEMQFA